MSAEEIIDTTSEAQANQTNQSELSEGIDTSQIESINNTYEKIQALCDQLSNQTKPFSNQANALLTEATALYDEAQRLAPNYKPPKNNTPQE